ncbi:SLATT domain-containing protein [Bacillus wiedmannii]|uniref:SLATT domain-containing protein n=1 Tax=Bacillus wiedmannii TaxID=1890302 RepID=UPI002E238A81|nr:SLATT domain-containing protein [Bacillus wiedmannii]
MDSNCYKEQINKLRKKANLSRDSHFMVASRYKIYHNFFQFIIITGSTIIAILTFANFDTFLPVTNNLTEAKYKLFVGIFASIIFIFTVIEGFLKFGEKVAEHENMGKQLTTFIRNADSVKNLRLLNEDNVTQLTMHYNMLNEAAPTIPTRFIIKAKKQLHQRIEISKMLEGKPFTNVFLFKIYMKIKQTNSMEMQESNKDTKVD